MLYDNKRFDKELRRLGKLAPERMPIKQLLKLENLVAWLRTKSPTSRYDYDLPDSCMLTKYFKENGYLDTQVLCYTFIIDDRSYGLPRNFNTIAYGRSGGRSTFGAALKRAEAYLTA